MVKILKYLSLIIITGLTFKSCTKNIKTLHVENSQNKSSQTLINAIEKGQKDKIAELIKTKSDLEVKDDDGKTALMIAAYNNDNDIAKMLIDAGADVNAQDKILNTPFLYAGANGNVQLLNLCLQNGARFDIYNRYGGTALIPAAEKGHLEIVKILTKVKGFPIDHVNKLGWTALIEAIILSSKSDTQTAIVKTLLEAGADINIPDNEQISPLQHAKNRKLNEIVTILEKSK